MKKIIQTAKAPAPIGPYSQAVLHNNTLFASGQIALDPVTGELVTGDIQKETERVMNNLEAVLEAAEMSWDHVLKCSIFLANMDDFPKVNEIYGRYFSNGNAPARETVQVSRLPKNVNVEISLVAMK